MKKQTAEKWTNRIGFGRIMVVWGSYDETPSVDREMALGCVYYGDSGPVVY